MKAIRVENPWNISCVDIKEPAPQPGDALIEIEAVGICGSDIGAYRGTNNLVTYPRIIGHEIVGRIVELEHPYPGLSVGDRVVVDPYLYCGHCYPCSVGRTNCCVELRVLGVHVDGGMTEYLSHPASMLVKIPDHMDMIDAALAEPLTISLHGIHRGGLQPGEFCTIIGAGPIGLAAAMVALAYDAKPIVIDLVPARLAFAKTLGVDYTIDANDDNIQSQISQITDGTMSQLVMECSGANVAVRNTLDYVSHAGRITLTGWPKLETSIPTDIITKKEIDIRGARTSAGEFEEALELISSKRVEMKKLLTKVVSLQDVPKTITDIDQNPGKYMKVVAVL